MSGCATLNVAYLIGEFANSYVLAKLKLATRGRWLWTRTIGSTVVGQALDSGVFVTLAFAGTVPAGVLTQIVAGQWVVKVLYEAAATPLTSRGAPSVSSQRCASSRSPPRISAHSPSFTREVFHASSHLASANGLPPSVAHWFMSESP